MQLLRDNLTLWTSSDGGEPEAPTAGETSKEAEKPAETKAAEPAADAPASEAPAATES